MSDEKKSVKIRTYIGDCLNCEMVLMMGDLRCPRCGGRTTDDPTEGAAVRPE
jgi:rRNA maturation endonuclease Nob1